MERKTPPTVPAKIFVPLTAKVRITKSVKPESTGVQFVPLLVERKMPLAKVPAKRFVPEAARDQTIAFVKPVIPLLKPVLTAVQLVPLFVERKTPPY